MKAVKKFFGITESKYVFEWADVSTLLTIINVALVLCGWYYAPIFGIVNSILSIILNVKFNAHINMYVMQLALLVLNFYFLTL